MLTYQQLDVLADSYIPVLLVICLICLVMESIKLGFKRKLNESCSLIIAIILVYMLMALDNHFRIWPSFGLDYSTHTALSLVFVIYLSSKSMPLLVFSLLSFLFYVLLMLYQEYHTLADIISTSAILLLPFWVLLFRKHLTTAEIPS